MNFSRIFRIFASLRVLLHIQDSAGNFVRMYVVKLIKHPQKNNPNPPNKEFKEEVPARYEPESKRSKLFKGI